MNRYLIHVLPAAMFLALALNGPNALAADTLIVNGKTASTDIRTIGGSPYVKLADIAKALGMVVIKRPDGKYEITKAGGTNQVEGVAQGKIGDVLFDGRWRFTVLSVQTPDSYTMKIPSAEPSSYPADTLDFNRTTHIVRAKPAYKLIIVQCRMTNGQKSPQTFWLARSTERPIKNSLADTQGESYPPVGYDLEGAPIQSKQLLPGAKTEFAILFCVPEATEMKDLVFTLQNNDSTKGNDVRVALTPEK